MIWNEMEIVNVRRFQERDIMSFAEAVEESHHIYDKRWPPRPGVQLVDNNSANVTPQKSRAGDSRGAPCKLVQSISSRQHAQVLHPGLCKNTRCS